MCVEWELGKLTNKEVLKNAWELIRFDMNLGDPEIEHLKRLMNKAEAKELEEILKS